MTEGEKGSVDVDPCKEDPHDYYQKENEKNQLDKYLIKMGDLTRRSSLPEDRDLYRAKYDVITTDSISTTTEEVSCLCPLEGKGDDKDTMRFSEEGEYGGASLDLTLDDQQSTKVDNGGSSGSSGSSSGRSSGGRSAGTRSVHVRSGHVRNGDVRRSSVSSLGKTVWAMGSAAASARKMDAPKFCDDKDLYPVDCGKLGRHSESFLINKSEMSKGKEDPCESLSSVKTPSSGSTTHQANGSITHQANGSITHQANGRLHDYASVLSGKEHESSNYSLRQNTHMTELSNESTPSFRPHGGYPPFVANQVNHMSSRNSAPHMFNGINIGTTVGGQKNPGADGNYTRMVLRGHPSLINCVHKSGNKNSLNALHLKNGGRCTHGVGQEGRGGSPPLGSNVKLIRGAADLERFVGNVGGGRSVNGVRNQEVARNGEVLRNQEMARSGEVMRNANSWRGSKGGAHSLAFSGASNNMRNISRTENLKSLSSQNSGMYHLSVRMNKLRSNTAVLSDPREAPPMLAVQAVPPVQTAMPPVQTTVPPVQTTMPPVQTAMPLLHGTQHPMHAAHPLHVAAHPIHTAATGTPKNAMHLLEGNPNYSPKVEDKKKLTTVSGGDVKVPTMTHPHVKSSVESANMRFNSSRFLSRSCFGGGHTVVDSFREGPQRVGRSLSFMGVSLDRDVGPPFQGVVGGPSGGRLPGSALPIRGDTRRGSFSGGVGVNVSVPFGGPLTGPLSGPLGGPGRDFPVHTCKGVMKNPIDSSSVNGGNCGNCGGYGGCGSCGGCGMAILKNLQSRQRGLTGPYKKINEEQCKVLKTVAQRRHLLGYKQMSNWMSAFESKCRGKNDKRRPSATSSLRSGIPKPNDKMSKEKEAQLLDVMVKEASKTIGGKKRRALSTKFEIKTFLLNTVKAIGIVQTKWKLKDFGMHFWFHIKCIEKERDLNFYVKFFDALFQIMTGKGIYFQPNDLNFLVNLFKEFRIYDCKNILRTSLRALNRYARRNSKDFSILDNDEDILDVNRALLLGGASPTVAAEAANTAVEGEAAGAGTAIRPPPSGGNFFDFLFGSLKDNHDALQKVGQEKLYLSNVFANFNELNYGELFHLFLRRSGR
ncbi:hypothetical protein PVBG_05121 [Plasmodium vivax Brazil I]|uniref:Uncharacterized protein n=1 Tax=Plasmodium vivax (strain Brazil I) TaxID=1033975 RepID=A0A0J9T0Z2_PLAV1|nr:hypothetical protein PVBG_05121 [Plasmodium vivax Brazil I]